jgi:hypothetical protein
MGVVFIDIFGRENFGFFEKFLNFSAKVTEKCFFFEFLAIGGIFRGVAPFI